MTDRVKAWQAQKELRFEKYTVTLILAGTACRRCCRWSCRGRFAWGTACPPRNCTRHSAALDTVSRICILYPDTIFHKNAGPGQNYKKNGSRSDIMDPNIKKWIRILILKMQIGNQTFSKWGFGSNSVETADSDPTFKNLSRMYIGSTLSTLQYILHIKSSL